MSKTRDTGYLANVIQVHDTGVRIMSGSTMLMAVSSSGAVTITGEISGSDAANALLLSGTGSVGFTTTSSFLAVSSSQQQVSASYIALSASYNTFSGSASTRITTISSSQQDISSSLLQVSASYISLSGSYNTFSGSASTRITVDSASLLQVSSSQQQISSSLLNVISVFATTGSNSFRANQSITGSLVVSSTITAQTLVVQTVTSSILYSSGSNIFGCDLNSRQTFTGSVNITGSTTLNGALTGTSATFNGDIAYNNVGNQNLIITSGAANNGRMYIYSAGNADIGFQASGSSWFLNKLGIGTNAPSDLLHIEKCQAGGMGMIIRNSCGATSNTSMCSLISLQLVGTGQTGQIGVNLIAGKEGDYSSAGTRNAFFAIQTACGDNLYERLRITSTGNVGIGTCCPLGIINNKGAQIDQGGHTTLMLGSGIINGGVIQASDDARRIFIGANIYDDVTNSWSQFCDCSGFAALDTLGYPDFGMARILVGKPNQSGYASDHIFLEAMNCNTSSYLKLRTATDNALYITNCGNIGFGEASPGNDKMVILGNNMHSNVWLRLKTAGCHGVKPAIHFDSGLSGTNYASKVIIMGGYSSPDSGAGGALVFYTNDTGETSQQRMCIDPRGAVTIMGALAKGSGSFRICHPLSSKVNTHALVHSFIEGPNADLIYSGHTKLVGGVSCINIDYISRMTEGTFEALNRCVRIFTTNETSWSAVKGKVRGNIVIIESENNTSEDEISWMVIGERQDQHMFETEWTDAQGRVITEPEIIIVDDNDIVA